MLIVGEHPHENCKKVFDIRKRKALIRKYGRCFCCMRKGHGANDCNSTQSAITAQEITAALYVTEVKYPKRGKKQRQQ